MPVACVAVVGKLNEPLFLEDKCKESDGPDGAMNMRKIVHAALDVIEERALRTDSVNTQYLGLLYPTDEHAVYGYISNMKIKFIVVLTSDVEASDNSAKQIFDQIHRLYIDTVCNPFYKLGNPLASLGFCELAELMLKKSLG